MDRRKRARAAAAAAASAIGLLTETAAAQGPFTRLENIANVAVTENGHRIDIRWHASAFELRYPDLPPATEHDYRWTGRRPALRWTCRARDARGSGSETLALRLYVPRHPLHEDIAQEGDRRYWVFALTGRARHETPVEVAAAGIDPVATTLMHDRVGAGERRPALWLRMPPRALLGRLAEVRPVQLRVNGDEVRLRLDFPLDAAAASAARIAGDECGG